MAKTTKTTEKEIMNAPVAGAVKLTEAGKKAVKKPTARKSATKIGEPVIVSVEESRKAEAKKAAAKVKKVPARAKKTDELKIEDYKTIIKDGVAVAVPKMKLEPKKSELPVISEDDKKRYAEYLDIFRTGMQAAQQATLKAAFALYEIYTHGLYRIDGYKSVQEFGLDLFGLKKTAVYNLINIVERFGAKIEDGKPVVAISDKYSGYSQSQLGVMVGHTDDELSAITPEMSVREIKDALKKSKPDDDKKEENEGGAKGKSGEDDQTPSDSEFRANLIHEFNTVDQWDAMLDPKDELDYHNLLSTIRHCLKQGHTVRIMDCFTAAN